MSDYSRYVTVPGQVMPAAGQVKIFPPPGVTLFSLFVREGDVVNRGQRLASAGSVHSLISGLTRETRLRQQLEEQKTLLGHRLETTNREFEHKRASVNRRVAGLRRTQRSLLKQQRLLTQRLELNAQQLTNSHTLAAKGFLASAGLKQQQERMLDLRMLEEQLLERKIRHSLELEEQFLLLKKLPIELKKTSIEIAAELAELDSRLIRLEGQEQFLITAPRSGSVSGLQLGPGDRISGSVPLLTILGGGEGRKVLLFVGSHAIGFLYPGQKVRLKYASFPYRQFGTHAGVIRSIDRSILMPSEIETGAAIKMALQEPVYRVEVQPAKSFVIAYGHKVALTSGMLLEADIELNSRPLWRWLFDPLLSLSG